MASRTRKSILTQADDSYFQLSAIHDYGLDRQDRELYLVGEPEAWQFENMTEPGVEFSMANRIIKNIRTLTLDSGDPVLIHMKTCGGDWMEGMAIYDAIQNCPCYVTILNYTHARSMSSLILQAADLRVMMPHSEFMFHHGEYGWGGELVTALSELDWYKHSMTTMCSIYVDVMKNTSGSKWAKVSAKNIRQWLNEQMDKKNNVFLSAVDAVKNGFADEIFDGNWKALK